MQTYSHPFDTIAALHIRSCSSIEYPSFACSAVDTLVYTHAFFISYISLSPFHLQLYYHLQLLSRVFVSLFLIFRESRGLFSRARARACPRGWARARGYTDTRIIVYINTLFNCIQSYNDPARARHGPRNRQHAGPGIFHNPITWNPARARHGPRTIIGPRIFSPGNKRFI